MIKDKEVAPEPQEHKCVAVDKPPYQCLTCGEMPKGIRTESVQVVENSKEQPSDTQNDTSELRQHLYNLFGQNFLDGDKPSEWKATTMNASEVKEFIDEFVVPLIAQCEQAAELRGRIDELDKTIEIWINNRVEEEYANYLERRKATLQATKPEKGLE